MVSEEVYKANREKAAARLEAMKSKRRMTYLLSQVKSKYGLNREEYFKLLDSVDWKCEVCSKGLTLNGTRGQHDAACIDHCHSTGSVRGVLCRTCNSAIGALGDTTGSVSKALKYLERATLRQF